ncbi:MAG: DUF402 domain-containing protein [Lactobacillales bacterium]|jgi:protein associated with RNAse G/E|nr:DUF402 domain-containing protein [Lactobacillales bacterium]
MAKRRLKDGDLVRIQSFKHDGSLHRTWTQNQVIKQYGDVILCYNHKTTVIESNEKRWSTREPAFVYFHKKYWFNVVIMLKEAGISYYCNMASPVVVDEEAIKYIDYDLDVKVFPNGDKKLLDENEYKYHSEKYNYPPEIAEIMTEQLKVLIEMINQKRGPFADKFVDIWLKRVKELEPEQNERKTTT